MEQDDSIWKRHQLRPTPCRRMVMECLDTSGRAMSEREIRLAVGEEFDRTTLYRNMISRPTRITNPRSGMRISSASTAAMCGAYGRRRLSR